VLIALLAVVLLCPIAPLADLSLPLIEPGEAHAQIWSPKGKKERKKPRKRRKRPSKKPAQKPNPADDEHADSGGGGDNGDDGAADDDSGSPGLIEEKADDDEQVDTPDDKATDNLDEEPIYEDEDSGTEPREDDASSNGNGESGAETEAGETTEGEGESFRIEDDLDNVGADVTFSASDLDTGAANGSSANVTRLETLAMAFLRLGIDAVHDEVPLGEGGAKAIGEDVFTFRAHARAEGIGRWGRSFKVKVAGRVNADLSLDSDTNIGVQRYEAEIWDTYVDWFAPHLDVRFGKQFVSWGKADLLSPNDVVNARDLRRGFLDRPTELRLPTLALNARLYDGPFSFSPIWIPVAAVNRFELLEGDYALLGPNAATAVERRVGAIVSALADDPVRSQEMQPILDIGTPPDQGIETGELGAAASLRFEKLDLGVYFLWGHERNPRIEVNEQLTQMLADALAADPSLSTLTAADIAAAIDALAQQPSPQPAVTVDYPRRLHFGGALAGRIEPIGIKLDVGYSPEANTILVPPGRGPLLSEPMMLPQLGATLSFDYDRGSLFNIVLEFSHLRVIDVPVGREVFQMDGDQLYLVASRFSWTPKNGPVTLRFLGFVDVTSPSYAVMPAIALSGHDNLSVEIAAMVFGGPEGSYGGVSDRNDEILLTVQYGL